jgi:hypothetical protein
MTWPPGYALYRDYQRAESELRGLERVTPDEARDEDGWTPELLTAGQRMVAAHKEWREWYKREQEPLGVSMADLMVEYDYTRLGLAPPPRLRP